MSADTSDLTYSPLCSKCKSIFASECYDWDFSKDSGPVHHATLTSLQYSASLGCYMCARLNEAFEGFGDATRFESIEFLGATYSTDHRYIGVMFAIEYVTSLDSKGYVFHGFAGLREESVAQLGMQTSLKSGTCSANTMRQARAWIDQCRGTHDRCTKSSTHSWLPTRLIYLEYEAISGISAKLRIHDTCSPSKPYLTLSHRWGSANVTTLTSEVIDQYQQNIPIQQLNPVFKDAFHVTLALGFAYIWIDSLCIVQNDEKDWKAEAKTMHQIYRGAVCNLSASEFESGEEGLLNNRRIHNPVPFAVHLAWPTVPATKNEGVCTCKEGARDCCQSVYGCDQIVGTTQRFIFTEGDPFNRVVMGPLFRRAWVLQEQILARRTLHFGKEQVFWECDEFIANEIWPSGFGTTPDNPFGWVSMFCMDYAAWRIQLDILSPSDVR